MTQSPNPQSSRFLRLSKNRKFLVYTDYSYRREGDTVFGERAFVVFLAEVARALDAMVLAGRLDPRPGRSHYRLEDRIEFVPLPHYESQVQPLRLALSLGRSLRRFWSALGRVDAVLLLGPHPVALAFAALAALRRRPIVLGVRQDYPAYARSRHPTRRWTHVAADLLDAAWRRLARHVPVFVVGPGLAHRYARSPRLLEISVSLVRASEIVSSAAVPSRSYDGELRMLSVGRLETEKNPVLLADVLALARQRDPRWRLIVCGEGPLERDLVERLRALSLFEHTELRGYVPIDGGLRELYDRSSAFLHVSWTEGLPQVLFEAFAAGLPVVATAVGGVADAVGEAGLLVSPGDAAAAADALECIATDAVLRERIVTRGIERVREHTIESEARRLVEFMITAGGRRS
jgi:glycosyltransferase involved in cell wall biosynthesis